jgi:hypothetical protein
LRKHLAENGKSGLHTFGTSLKEQVDSGNIQLQRPAEGVTQRDWLDYVEYMKATSAKTEEDLNDINDSSKKTADATSNTETMTEEAQSEDKKAEERMKNKTGSKSGGPSVVPPTGEDKSKAGGGEGESEGSGSAFSKLGKLANLKNLFTLGKAGLGALGSSAAFGIGAAAGVGLAGGYVAHKAGSIAIDTENVKSNIVKSQNSIESQQADLRTRQLRRKYGMDTSKGAKTFAQMREEARKSGKQLSASEMKAMTDDAKLKLREVTLGKLESKYGIKKTPEYLKLRESLLDPNITERQFFDRLQTQLPDLAVVPGENLRSFSNNLSSDLRTAEEQNTKSMRRFKDTAFKPEIVAPDSSKDVLPGPSTLTPEQIQKDADSTNEAIAKSMNNVANAMNNVAEANKTNKVITQYLLPPRMQTGLTASLQTSIW